MSKIRVKSISTTSPNDKRSFLKLPYTLGELESENHYITLKEKLVGHWEIETNKNCMICWMPVKTSDKISRCQNCNNKFHKDHWNQWISRKKTCPVCNTKPLT